ncbi:NADP-dependent oxidoreductase [Microbacterium paludicola]|uniref:NADP-dependent oxidoreductase n=1 Tax=Microbacterium paludicola TaxID=300019 RepID=A0A4Y9FZP3_9MICO|nr:NADP-dependent oxidoreductase [Microbacterium paludicola]MBF0815544.1 NADP-dependent oxidoreductase [Microbacterium paludicola]TFU33808.1 NADP-dependent oxidoreductase [Microbacterium paludicola]
MKAAVITSFGDPSVLRVAEAPQPTPGRAQVLVRVHAAGVNPAEILARAGAFRLRAPAIIGFEFAGVVEGVGPGVDESLVGERVAGWPDSATQGSYAEYTVSSNYATIPDGVSFEQAAATVIGADNAARALGLLNLHPGDTLVVTGASGALGSAAVQFARHRGVTVIGVAGTSNADFVESLGAIPVAHGPGLVARIRAAAPDGVDAALDTAGKGLLPALIEVLGSPERVVTLADRDAAKHDVAFSPGGSGNRDHRPVQEALDLIAAGAWTARVGRSFPLAKAADAHRLVATGHTHGKVIILP